MPLQNLEPISKLSPRITRILGQNPGSFTLQGTNTYLVGSHSPFLLLDTGEGKSGYIPLLESCLAPGDIISDIVISHRHRDHWGGLRDVLKMLSLRRTKHNAAIATSDDRDATTVIGPIVWKYPEEESHFDQEIEQELGGDKLKHLSNGQILNPPGASLQVVHTPGHTSDSISLLLKDDQSVFTADTVLGESTAVFSDLSTYLASLQLLLSLSPTILYPGHGPTLPSGREALETYISHRLARENQIIALLREPPPDRPAPPGGWDVALSSSSGSRRVPKGWTVEELVLRIYPDVGFILRVAAGRGADLHLEKLRSEGRAKYVQGEAGTVFWELVE